MTRTFGTAGRIFGPSLDGMVENRAENGEKGYKEEKGEVLGKNDAATVAEHKILVLLRRRKGLRDRAIFMSIENRHVQTPAGRTYLLIV